MKIGSSPLTRGKLRTSEFTHYSSGLIPAHAGKTRRRRTPARPDWAHPRSRGENLMNRVSKLPPSGSSPLTRGKHVAGVGGRTGGRLIPAHAGKTGRQAAHHGYESAHPRSRGENPSCSCRLTVTVGSSPLTRGKLGMSRLRRGSARLIPAHAGKTNSTGRPGAWQGAHPRSRGENVGDFAGRRSGQGSSPLTRGKRQVRRRRFPHKRLIPAHAGKTSSVVTF